MSASRENAYVANLEMLVGNIRWGGGGGGGGEWEAEEDTVSSVS